MQSINPRFELDYSALSNLDKKTYKYSDVKHLLIKVAFDVVKFRDAPENELWEVMQADDGDYIVARYNEDDALPKEATASTKSNWEALAKNNEVHIFYKGAAIVKFEHENPEMVKRVIASKLDTDPTFLNAFIKFLPRIRQREVQMLYPELF